MAKAWSYWLPDLLPHVAGVPVAVAEFELRRAAQQLFTQARAWKVTLPAIPVAAAAQSVTVAMPDAGQELVRVEKAWYDGVEIGVTTVEELDDSVDGDWTEHTGTPNKVYQTTPGVVSLYPIPETDAATGLKLRVSVQPSETATGLPDEMAVKFRDTIAAGAKARLMLYPNKPWSNPQMAVVYAGGFEAGVSKAGVQAAQSYSDARKPARPKWF